MTDTASFYRGLPAKRSGAGILITREAEEVLLVQPTYKDRWEIPGGACEADESPYAAAGREVMEELALDVAVGRLLVVDWTSPAGARTEAFMFVFDAPPVDPQTIRLQDTELCGWQFVHQSRLEDFVVDRMARRLRAALQAKRMDQTMYLEDGRQAPRAFRGGSQLDATS